MRVRKTAADPAPARPSWRGDAEALLIFGAGALAPHFAEAHLAVRPTRRSVTIWNRTAARAAAVTAGLREKGIDATVCKDFDGSVARADLVACVTMSDKALAKGALLRPRRHLDLGGA
jgi:ornithine cyclodeaminase/alanine dehydrogenase-like protein (mu-crystallin family)